MSRCESVTLVVSSEDLKALFVRKSIHHEGEAAKLTEKLKALVKERGEKLQDISIKGDEDDDTLYRMSNSKLLADDLVTLKSQAQTELRAAARCRCIAHYIRPGEHTIPLNEWDDLGLSSYFDELPD